MKKLLLSATAAILAVAGSLALAPTAQASNTPNIIGGTTASNPWAVQLLFVQGGGTYGCTGEQINASWVLTANHCADGTTSMNVYHSNSTSNRGPASPVDALYSAPSGDIALAHLATPYNLGSYPSLNLSYTAKSSGTGTIQGYGARAYGASSPGLYQATVNLTGGSTDAYGGRAQHLNGSNGAANHGDSGGPLLVNGSIVGVCSTGDEADPGGNINAGSNYAILAQSSSWIRSTAGV